MLDHIYENSEKLLGQEIAPIFVLKLSEWRVTARAATEGYSWQQVVTLLKTIEANCQSSITLRMMNPAWGQAKPQQTNFGQLQTESPLQPQSGKRVSAGPPPGGWTCWNCLGKGHKQFDCPNPKKSRVSGFLAQEQAGRSRSGSDPVVPSFKPNGKVFKGPKEVSFKLSSVYQQAGIFNQLFKMVGNNASEQDDAKGRYVNLLLEFRTGKQIEAIVDTACSGFGIMDETIPERLGLQNDLVSCQTRVTLADKNIVKTSEKICRTLVRAGQRPEWLEFVVLKDCDFDVVIGKKGLDKFHLLFGLAEQIQQMNSQLKA